MLYFKSSVKLPTEINIEFNDSFCVVPIDKRVDENEIMPNLWLIKYKKMLTSNNRLETPILYVLISEAILEFLLDSKIDFACIWLYTVSDENKVWLYRVATVIINAYSANIFWSHAFVKYNVFNNDAVMFNIVSSKARGYLYSIWLLDTIL